MDAIRGMMSPVGGGEAIQRNQPGKEVEHVASLRFVLPILPDKEEAWRRFYQEISGSRRTEYELSRRRLGITRECIWVSQALQGEIAIVHLEASDPEQVIQQLAASDLPFDRWFRQHLQEFHGLDVTQPEAAPPKELIFVWHIGA